MANNELKLEDCPFCGSSPDHLNPGALGFARAPGKIWLCCPCGSMGPEGATQDEAIAAWNRRGAPAQGGLSDALPELPSSFAQLPRLDGTMCDAYTPNQMRAYAAACIGALVEADAGGTALITRLMTEINNLRGQQGGVSDAADRGRLNWIEDQSDFGPIEITLGKGTPPNTTATYLTYGADDGSRISSGPARHVRAAIDQCRNPDAAIQAQAGDAPGGSGHADQA